MKSWLVFSVCAALAATLPAGELAGVNLPDTLQVDGEKLLLNGMGLRKKAFIKVYVAGLYLPARKSDPEVILEADAPRRTVMHFIFGVGAGKMCDAWADGLEANTPGASAEVEGQFDRLCQMMEDLGKGDRLVVTYRPDQGTEIDVKGKSKGTIPGKAFADALFACWIGPEPPGKALKKGLLGG